MPLPSGFDRTATYVGASGRASTYPLRKGAEAPRSLTMASGEVRELRMVQYDDVSVEDAFPVSDEQVLADAFRVVGMGVSHE